MPEERERVANAGIGKCARKVDRGSFVDRQVRSRVYGRRHIINCKGNRSARGSAVLIPNCECHCIGPVIARSEAEIRAGASRNDLSVRTQDCPCKCKRVERTWIRKASVE